MGKKSLLIIAAVVAVICVAAYFIFSGSTSSNGAKLASIIPNDADIVIKIDGKELFGKTGLDNEKTEKILAKMNLKEEFAKDPKKIGIDFREPMFAFCNIGDGQNMTGGLVCKVLNEGDFKNFVEKQMDAKITTKDGVNYAKEHDAVVAFNGESILFFGGVRRKGLEEQAEKLFTSKENKFADTKLFKEMSDIKQDISVLASFKSFDKLPGYKKSSFCNYGSIKADDLKDVNLAGGLSFENGEIDCKASILTENENVIKSLKDDAKNINGEYLNLFTDDCLLYFVGQTEPSKMGIAFDNMLESLKSEGLNIDEETAQVFQTIKDLFCGIEGDLAFSASMTNGGLGGIPLDINFAAHTKGNKTLECASNLLNKFGDAIKSNGGEINKVNENTYVINALGKTIAMGMDKESFYLTTAGEASKMFGLKQGTSQHVKGDIKSCNSFCYFNFKPLMPFAQMYNRELATVASEFDNIHMFGNTDGTSTARIMMTNEKDNALKVICNLIFKLADL